MNRDNYCKGKTTRAMQTIYTELTMFKSLSLHCVTLLPLFETHVLVARL